MCLEFDISRLFIIKILCLMFFNKMFRLWFVMSGVCCVYGLLSVVFILLWICVTLVCLWFVCLGMVMAPFLSLRHSDEE